MKTHAESALRDSGLKVTDARVAILEAFPLGCKPMRAEDIFKKVSSITDLVTVYRTLTTFEKAGILQRIDLHKDATYYESTEHHHHHLICTDCGRVEGFDICDVNAISKKVLSDSANFNSISRHSLELFGICKSCTKV